MRANSFLESLERNPCRPVYLFLGAEAYRRSLCREALRRKLLPEEERESGFTRHSLEEIPLAEVIDDARSLSLFSPNRLIWVSSAELVVARGRSRGAEDAGASSLTAYLKDPSPGVVLVLEASRYELSGEGKRKLERVRKYFAAIPAGAVVEFPPDTPEEAHQLTRELARAAHLKLGTAEAGLLAEAAGYDSARIANEIEKLRLYVGQDRSVTARDITGIVPNARVATIFELVAALGRGDRKAALGLLDTLVEEGEYLPLALSFLETQFRQALVVKELGLRTPNQIRVHFQETGARIWLKKAREIQQTAAAFTAAQLKAAVGRIYQADKALRDARPDDRTVVEKLALSLRQE